MGRTAGNPSSIPFHEVILESLEARGYGPESVAFILADYASSTARRPILTKKAALAELNLCELLDIARRKRHG